MLQQTGGNQPYRGRDWSRSRIRVARYRRYLSRLGFFIAWAALALLIPALRASGAEKQPAGQTGRQVRQEATRLVPANRLDPAYRNKVVDVVNNAGVFRRLPTQVIDCDPLMYTFLLDNPEMVVNMWQVLGISDMELSRTASNTFHADDGAGTTGSVELVYRNHDTYLWYAEGTYDGSMLPRKVRGRCVMLLKSGFVREPDGRYYVTCRLDAWVDLENIGVDLLARTFQPFVGPIADHNFRETTNFASSLSRAAEVNYAGVQQLAAELDGVSEDRREKFSQVCERVAVQAATAKAETVIIKEEPPRQSLVPQRPNPRTAQRPGTRGR